MAANLCVTSLFAATSFAGSGKITVDESYKIVVGEDSGLESAAQALAGYIEDVGGFAPQVTDEYSEPCILVDVDGGKVENGYIIESDEKNITVCGSTLRQAVRGIYYFVEEFAGIKCYTSKIKVYEKDEVSIPVNYSYTYHPYFEYCEEDWLSPRDVEYSLFNGLNGDDYRHIEPEFGGTVDYISSFAYPNIYYRTYIKYLHGWEIYSCPFSVCCKY